MKTTFQYDHYYKYDEVKSNLEYFATTYPKLAMLDVNMTTEEGRNQYVITLTNTEKGAPDTKPALYIDGNIHAGEVTSTMAAMHTIDYLLTNYGSDPEVTKLLDEKTFYVIPRVTPDGAEKYLSTSYTLRSAPRPYNVVKGGIQEEDIDEDGVIRMMRIPTPYGAWKKDENTEMGMSPRCPSDVDGEYYDIYPEGIFESYDGDENLKRKKAEWGLDFNRNFPLGWNPDGIQQGAGKYPLCNPETKALVDFALAHNNIGGAAIGHTSGGMLLYPPGTRPEKSAPNLDMKCLKEIAAMGKEELGYEPMNIFDTYTQDQDHCDSGAFDDWFYQSQGVPAYTVEFWDVDSKAGMRRNWNDKTESKETELKRFNAVYKWIKENAPEAFVPWKEYDHPTFGKVEIGGVNYKFTTQNPPAKFLLPECEHDTKFNLRFAKTLPTLHVESLSTKKVSEGVYEVEALIGNRSYLPTNLTEEANKLKVSKPVIATISGCEVASGKAEVTLGHLAGFSSTESMAFYGSIQTFESAKAKKKVVWIVKAMEGTEITVTAKQEKAGVASLTITL